jgi:hypothetical protein
MSPVATLVEWSTRFLMLVALPRGDSPGRCCRRCAQRGHHPLAETAGQIPDLGPRPRDGPARPLHPATGITVYFCDPKSPWQRGSNENTNGLLRQYLPRRLNRRELSQDDFDAIATEVNDPSTNAPLQDTIRCASRGVAFNGLNPHR